MQNTTNKQQLVSLKTLAALLDADRTTIKRWLHEAGIQPVIIGQGRRGAIRYPWKDIQQWIHHLQQHN